MHLTQIRIGACGPLVSRYNSPTRQRAEQPNPTRKAFEDLLSSVELSSEFVQKVRFRDPVGKLALLGIVCVAGLGGVGIRTTDSTVAGLYASPATVVALAIGGAILWYSHVHPDQATLEG